MMRENDLRLGLMQGYFCMTLLLYGITNAVCEAKLRAFSSLNLKFSLSIQTETSFRRQMEEQKIFIFHSKAAF